MIQPHENRARVEVAADKSLTAEYEHAGEQLTWSAYFKKVWRGPWSSGATFKW